MTVVLPVRTIERAVEDVVRADVDEVRPDGVTRPGKDSRCCAVDGEREVDVRLARIHRCVRRGIDHGVRPHRVEQGPHRIGVGDVERRLVDADHVIADRTGMGNHVEAQLPRGAGDEQLHG